MVISLFDVFYPARGCTSVLRPCSPPFGSSGVLGSPANELPTVMYHRPSDEWATMQSPQGGFMVLQIKFIIGKNAKKNTEKKYTHFKNWITSVKIKIFWICFYHSMWNLFAVNLENHLIVNIAVFQQSTIEQRPPKATCRTKVSGKKIRRTENGNFLSLINQ